MAIYKNGILGSFSNKLGTVVGRHWKGKAVMAALPSSVTDPKSDKQERVRSKFGLRGHLAAVLLGAINVGLRREANKRISTQIAEFVRLNWNSNIEDGYYDEVTIAKGTLPGIYPHRTTPVVYQNNIIRVQFTRAPRNGRGELNDTVIAVAYCPAEDQMIMASQDARMMNVELTPPAAWSGKIAVWAFVSAINQKKERYNVSKSVFMGTVTI